MYFPRATFNIFFKRSLIDSNKVIYKFADLNLFFVHLEVLTFATMQWNHTPLYLRKLSVEIVNVTNRMKKVSQSTIQYRSAFEGLLYTVIDYTFNSTTIITMHIEIFLLIKNNQSLVKSIPFVWCIQLTASLTLIS